MIDIIIPTLGRPHRLALMAANIKSATFSEHRIVFVCEARDPDSIAAVEALGLEPVINQRTHNYQGAVNTAWLQSDAEWVFCGADDLNFYPGWDVECWRHRDGPFKVFGTNDLLNAHVLAGTHSTHSLVHRSYLEEVGGVVDEGPGSFLFEGFDHSFCDTEFIATAKMRAVFRPCLDSIVEHLHVINGKAEMDATYQRSMAEFDRDQKIYEMRMPLWARLFQ